MTRAFLLFKIEINIDRLYYLMIKLLRKKMPEFRGKGLGSSIMQPMLENLDNNHQDCYLETLLPINVDIYKKYGFELKEEVNVPNTDLTLYAMLRVAKK